LIQIKLDESLGAYDSLALNCSKSNFYDNHTEVLMKNFLSGGHLIIWLISASIAIVAVSALAVTVSKWIGG